MSNNYSQYDASIGNFEAGAGSIYDQMGQKEYKYKKEFNLTEEEEKFRHEEHARILARKHKREQEKLKHFMSNYSDKVG